MGKNITIETDGVAVKYSGVEEIHTKDTDGNRTTWVPRDELKTGEITIKANGTYKAKSSGLYGFSKVIVKAKAKTTGKKKDGNTYSVSTDDQGRIVEFILPTTIKVETPPTKTSYADGETIDKTGMVVKAYRGDGQLWETDGYGDGIVPNSEISLEPSVAEAGEGSGTTASTELDISPLSSPIEFVEGTYVKYNTNIIIATKNLRITGGREDKKGLWCLGASAEEFTYDVYTQNGEYLWGSGMRPRNYTMNGKTVYFTGGTVEGNITGAERPQTANFTDKFITLTSVQASRVAWALVYGDISGGALITANWPRFDDEEILSDTFDITVS